MKDLTKYIFEQIKPMKDWDNCIYSDSELVNDIFTIIFGQTSEYKIGMYNKMKKSDVNAMIKWLCDEYPNIDDYTIKEIHTTWKNNNEEIIKKYDVKTVTNSYSEIKHIDKIEGERAWYGSSKVYNTFKSNKDVEFNFHVVGQGKSISVRFIPRGKLDDYLAVTYIDLEQTKDSRTQPDISKITKTKMKGFARDMQAFIDEFDSTIDDIINKPEHQPEKFDKSKMITGALYYIGQEHFSKYNNKWEWDRFWVSGIKADTSAVSKVEDFLNEHTDLPKKLQKIYKKYQNFFDTNSIELINRKNFKLKTSKEFKFNNDFKKFLKETYNIDNIVIRIWSDYGMSNGMFGFNIEAWYPDENGKQQQYGCRNLNKFMR